MIIVNKQLVPAYLIHARAFRDSSLLIDFFTEDHGVIKAVAKGARSYNKNNLRGVLQPFSQLFINWRGRSSDLVTLNTVELAEQPVRLNRKYLAIGFYLNELLYLLCSKSAGVVFDGLFNKYRILLDNLKILNDVSIIDNSNIEINIREFELDLLDSIGYGLQFKSICSNRHYAYDFSSGFYLVNDIKINKKILILNGALLLNIMQRNWSDEATLLAAKKLLRSIMTHHIGGREIMSRELLIIE